MKLNSLLTKKTTRRESFAMMSALLATLSVAPLMHGMKPLVRPSKAPLKLSLAAYSMRRFLPDTRADPQAIGEMDLLGFIDYASTLGLDAVELTSYFMPYPLTQESICEIKRRTHLNGLDISGGAIGNNFTNDPASEEGRRQMKFTRMWVDRYAALGAPVIRVFGGRPATGISELRAVKNIIANMSLACDYAGEKGVVLGMENHDFLTDIDRMIPIVEAVDSPWFGVNFDSGNIALSDDPYRELARIAPYAVNAQIKTTIPMVGRDEKVPSDLRRIIAILRNANYRGYIVLEYEEAEDPYKAIPRYLSKLRNLI